MNEYLHFKRLKIPIYGGLICIIISNSIEKVKKYLPEYEYGWDFASTWPYFYKGCKSKFIVLNFDNNNKYDKITHGVISHECLHAVHFIADEKGIVADFNNDEAIAYLLKWCVDEVTKFCKAKGFNIN